MVAVAVSAAQSPQPLPHAQTGAAGESAQRVRLGRLAVRRAPAGPSSARTARIVLAPSLSSSGYTDHGAQLDAAPRPSCLTVIEIEETSRNRARRVDLTPGAVLPQRRLDLRLPLGHC